MSNQENEAKRKLNEESRKSLERMLNEEMEARGDLHQRIVPIQPNSTPNK